MEKLTKQELSAYLPWDIEVLWGHSKADLIGIIRNAVVLNSKFWSESQKTSIEYIKPILYPLSHLTKEIEHKGEKFVSYEKLGNRPNLLDYRIDEINFQRLPYELVTKLHEWHFDTFGLIDRGLAIDKTTL